MRHVIPSKGNYLLDGGPGTDGAPGELRRRALVSGGEDDPLLPHLLANIDESESLDMAVAFVLPSGVRRIEPRLRDLLARGGSVRLLTGDYMDVTEPDALLRLLDLEGRFELRVFEARGTSFHPKAYIFRRRGGEGVAYVGSSNLTEPALTGGVEWNYRVVSSEGGGDFADVAASFEELFRYPSTRPVDAEWVAEYRRRRKKRGVLLPPAEVEEEAPEAPPAPHEVQAEALAALDATRGEGNSAGLVVLATGLGKTWLSAFDSDRPEYRRVLFVAHREEILAQAMQHLPARPPPGARSASTRGRRRARRPTSSSRRSRRSAAPPPRKVRPARLRLRRRRRVPPRLRRHLPPADRPLQAEVPPRPHGDAGAH